MVTKSQPVNRLTDLSRYGDTTRRLPYWARSTNPIVRRHLGLYWRTIPPDPTPFFYIYAVWFVVLVLGMLLPSIFSLTMLSFLASIMIIPVMLVMYGHVLLSISIDAARNMQMEMNNDTFRLLQATPMSLSQILLGKVAAAMWKRMDDIVMVAQAALAFSPPIIFTLYSGIWELKETTTIAPLLTLIATLVTVFRLLAEPIMVGTLSVFIGLVVPGRSRAISTAIALSTFYFVLLNVASGLPMVRGAALPDGSILEPNIGLILLFDLVLPLALPILMTISLLRLATYIINTD